MDGVDSSARVAPGATVGDGVRVGPFCVVGPDVVLGDGVVLDSHVVVTGRTTIGAGSRVSPFSALGGRPQQNQHQGADGEVSIGAGVTIREHVTIHAGSSVGGLRTEIGDGSLLMVGSHVAHDCQLGPRCTLVNGVQLGGHVVLGEGVFVGGATTVHQFVRLGAHAYVGGGSAVERDVVPWGLAWGNRATLRGPNLVGMRRAGMDGRALRRGQALFEVLFGVGDEPLQSRVDAMEDEDDDADRVVDPVAAEVLRFLGEPSRRGVLGRMGR